MWGKGRGAGRAANYPVLSKVLPPPQPVIPPWGFRRKGRNGEQGILSGRRIVILEMEGPASF